MNGGVDTKVLVVAQFYKFFIKELIDSLAKQEKISEINILVHHNYLSELSRILPISYSRWVAKFRKENLIDTLKSPNNVKTHLLSTLYFIPDGRNKGLGDKLFKLFDKYLQRNKIKFDIIHAQYTWPQGYVAVKLGQKYNTPVVITLHEPQIDLRRNASNSRLQCVWRKANALIRVNQTDIPLLREFNERVYYIPNGFNPAKIPRISRSKTRDLLIKDPKITNKKIVLNVANLVPRKGQKYLIEAMKIVSKKEKDVICYIGGEGPFKKKLEDQIKKLNLQEHVKLLGFI
ncbi:MAG: glycosyltransferase, partial [Candidatus Aenigmatarchaeota archaeon]